MVIGHTRCPLDSVMFICIYTYIGEALTLQPQVYYFWTHAVSSKLGHLYPFRPSLTKVLLLPAMSILSFQHEVRVNGVEKSDVAEHFWAKKCAQIELKMSVRVCVFLTVCV